MMPADADITAATPMGEVALSGTGADLCRVTVHGPDGRADLAIPSVATIGLLIPVLAGYVNRQHEGGGAWVLQRLGEAPLDPDSTPDDADLHDGDVLYLRPAEDPLPELTYDDLAEGVADAISHRGDRWTPESTRRILLGLAVVAEVTLGIGVLFGGGPGGLAALYCAVATLTLGGGAVAIHHLSQDRPLSLVGGVGACAFAALAGLVGPQPVADVFSPQPSGLLLGGICAVLVAAAIAVATRDGIAVYGTAVLLGVASIAGSLLMSGTSADVPGSVSVVAVALFLAGTFGPRVAARLARLRVPNLPRTNEELQQDIDPVSGSLVAARADDADGYLSAVIVSSSVVALVDSLLVVRVDGWISWVLPLFFGFAALLRARSPRSVWQRGATLWAGALSIAVVALTHTLSLSPVGRIGLLVVMLIAVALLVVGAWRLPNTRLLPIWGQLADIAELWTAIVLVPLLLVLLDAYAYFRALAG
jgi:ESX secretion system protein EccD